MLDGLDELVDANDHFEFYVFPHSDAALTRTQQPRRRAAAAARARAAAWREDVLLTNHAFHAFCRAGRRAARR